MKEIHKIILKKAIELCILADSDEILYGDSFVEIGERSISVLDAKKIEVNHNSGCINKIYGKSPLKSMGEKK